MEASIPTFAIPRISTARLLLRESRLDDFPAYAADCADPIARAAGGSPTFEAREAWRRFHAGAGYWVTQGMGWWMVEERAHGVVGMVGVFRRETKPDLEMGWSIYRDHWGRGYATEAGAAALLFAVGSFQARRVVAYIGRENVASAKVATKIGMRLEGEASFYDDTAFVYAFEVAASVRTPSAPQDPGVGHPAMER